MRTGLRIDVMAALLAATLLSAATFEQSLEWPMVDAAKRGDAAAVRELIQQGADVNEAYGDGMTALHWAAQRGDFEIAQLLIAAGANLQAGTRIGHYTALHLASRTGSAPVVEALLKAGSEVNATTTNSGATPLHLAAESGNAEVIGLLTEHGADLNVREAEWGQTPLMLAAAHNRVVAIKALLARGADLGMTTRVVNVPQREAVDKAARERLRELVDHFRVKADANDSISAELRRVREIQDNMGGGDQILSRGAEEGVTPSQVQAAIRAAREVQRNRTLQVDSKDSPRPPVVQTWGGLTALLHAARAGHTEAVLALLDAGADIHRVSAGDRTSPLLIATMNGHFDLALVLLQQGADPNLASDAGATPLFAVVNTQWSPKTRYAQPRVHEQQSTTYLQVMRALLDAGADPNARLQNDLWWYFADILDVDFWGATPFWRAAYATDVEAMRLLVAYGADPSIPTRKAREYRARYGEEEVKDLSGLPPIPVGGPGVYPIHAASGVGYGEGYAANAHRHVPNGWLPAMKYLVEELGADVNARDHNGFNAVHHAAARGDTEMVLFLVRQGTDVTALSRRGQTTADMANSPYQRVPPYPETRGLLEALGSRNNHNCQAC